MPRISVARALSCKTCCVQGAGESETRGRPTLVDNAAVSASPGLPAFLARPVGAPVYHGFPLIEESAIDGWMLGLISDFGGPDAHFGDGYVVAPDGNRCGLVWECCSEAASLDIVLLPTPDRWGVYSALLPGPLHGPDDALAFLTALRPHLEPRWRVWAGSRR